MRLTFSNLDFTLEFIWVVEDAGTNPLVLLDHVLHDAAVEAFKPLRWLSSAVAKASKTPSLMDMRETPSSSADVSGNDAGLVGTTSVVFLSRPWTMAEAGSLTMRKMLRPAMGPPSLVV